MAADMFFEAFQLGGLRLPNRFVMVAMSRYNSPGGIPTSELAAFHRARAAGAVGLSITGATGIDRPAANNHPTLANIRTDSLDGWRGVVDEVHAENGLIALQLWHAGALFNVAPDWHPGPIESPSGLVAPDRPVGKPMSEEAIADTIASFARATRHAQAIGFDTVEIHAAHGFLIDEFFWPATNRRTDRWGGASITERNRFAIEVVRAVRAVLPADKPLLMRVSQWKEQDYDARIARTPDELHAWVAPLAEAGIDCFDCSQRRFWEPEFPDSDRNFAGWVKQLTGKPVITAGSVGLSSEVMSFFEGAVAEPARLDELERRFERGDFDLIGIGRALLADPDWVIKVRDDRQHELKPFDRRVAGIDP